MLRKIYEVLAARMRKLTTARARKNKRTARMLANVRKDHSIPLFDLCDSLLGSQFSCHATQKLRNSNVLYYNKKNPVELKHCETSSSCRVFYLMNLKPEKERYYLILEHDYVT